MKSDTIGNNNFDLSSESLPTCKQIMLQYLKINLKLLNNWYVSNFIHNQRSDWSHYSDTEATKLHYPLEDNKN